MRIKKFLKKFVLAAGLLTLTAEVSGGVDMNIAYAEIIEQTVDAVGEYRMGDNETRISAKEAALADAKRVAAEKVLTRVESSTDIENFTVLKDRIKSYTNANLKILEQKYSFGGEEGTLCTATIVATVKIDTDDFKNISDSPIQPLPGNDNNNNQQQQPSYDQQQPPPYQQKIDPPPYNYDYPPPPPPIQKPQRKEYNGHHYQIFDEGLDWYDAQSFCENEGGHLVTIGSEGEQRFVEALLAQGEKNSYWIGGRKKVGSGKLYWVDDTPFEYTNWAEEQPDHISELALMIYRRSNPMSPGTEFGKWNDLAADGKFKTEEFFGLENFGFICEWDY